MARVGGAFLHYLTLGGGSGRLAVALPQTAVELRVGGSHIACLRDRSV